MALLIPKIIHLTWKTNQVPDVWAETLPSWKRLFPDWEVRLWTDDDNDRLVRTCIPSAYRFYRSLPYGIQRADFVRYVILWEFGGMYSDMDILPTKNFEDVLGGCKADALLVMSGNVEMFTNSFMASPPRSPFWETLIREIIFRESKWYEVGKHMTVMHSTGPAILDEVARRYTRPLIILPKNVFMAYDITDHAQIKPLAALRPLQGGSWNEWDSKLLNTLFVLFKHRLRILIPLVVLGCGIVWYNIVRHKDKRRVTHLKCYSQ